MICKRLLAVLQASVWLLCVPSSANSNILDRGIARNLLLERIKHSEGRGNRGDDSTLSLSRVQALEAENAKLSRDLKKVMGQRDELVKLALYLEQQVQGDKKKLPLSSLHLDRSVKSYIQESKVKHKTPDPVSEKKQEHTRSWPQAAKAKISRLGELWTTKGVLSAGLFHECGLCMECEFDSLLPDTVPNQIITPPPPPPMEANFSFEPRPNCTKCLGCSATLRPVPKKVEYSGVSYSRPTGASKPRMYFVDFAGSKRKNSPVVKLHGFYGQRKAMNPVDVMVSPINGKGQNPSTSGLHEFAMVKFLVRFLDACPVFKDIVTLPLIKGVRTAVPEEGWKMEIAEMVMNEFAEGISPDKLLRLSSNLDKWNDLIKSINSTQLVLTAIFDFLIAQGDRHAENMHIREDGNVKLIDNFDKSLLYPNSFQIPQSYISERLYVSNGGLRHPVSGLPPVWSEGRVDSSSWPILNLDYRCHVSGQKMGVNFPIGVDQCLDFIARPSTSELAETLGISDDIAVAMQLRAFIMKNVGFEEAIAVAHTMKPQARADATLNGQRVRDIQFYNATNFFEHQTFIKRPPCCKLGLRQKTDNHMKGRFTCEGVDITWNHPTPEKYKGDPQLNPDKQEVPRVILDPVAMLKEAKACQRSKNLSRCYVKA